MRALLCRRDLACDKSIGEVELVDWRQGRELHQWVDVPKVRYNNQLTLWDETVTVECWPRCPSTFFTLRFPKRAEEASFFDAWSQGDWRRNRVGSALLPQQSEDRLCPHLGYTRRRHPEQLT